MKCGLRSKDRVGARVCGSSQELTECVTKKTPRGGLALKAGSSVRCWGTQAWITECLILALYWTYRPFSSRIRRAWTEIQERSTESLPVSFCAQNSNRINEGGSVPFLGEVTPSSQFPMTGSIVQSHSWDCPGGPGIKNPPANAAWAFQWQELKSLFSSWKWKKWKKA